MTDAILIMGIASSLIGSIILALPYIKTTGQIEQESGTFWDYNPHIRKRSYRDRILATVGLLLIANGVFLNIVYLTL